MLPTPIPGKINVPLSIVPTPRTHRERLHSKRAKWQAEGFLHSGPSGPDSTERRRVRSPASRDREALSLLRCGPCFWWCWCSRSHQGTHGTGGTTQPRGRREIIVMVPIPQELRTSTRTIASIDIILLLVVDNIHTVFVLHPLTVCLHGGSSLWLSGHGWGGCWGVRV